MIEGASSEWWIYLWRLCYYGAFGALELNRSRPSAGVTWNNGTPLGMMHSKKSELAAHCGTGSQVFFAQRAKHFHKLILFLAHGRVPKFGFSHRIESN
jgi:hypothetical protein